MKKINKNEDSKLKFVDIDVTKKITKLSKHKKSKNRRRN